METRRSINAAPIIAALLLLLPVLYVVSYLVLVNRQPMVAVSLTSPTQYSADFYRFGGDYAETFFWPLEQIDRKLQPGKWRELGWQYQSGRAGTYRIRLSQNDRLPPSMRDTPS